MIPAGGRWEEEIAAGLESADLILLLISPAFIDSYWCFEKEMQRALERSDADARVIPIIVRDCAWTIHPFARLNVLPRDGKPLHGRRNRDAAWAKITMEVEALIVNAEQPARTCVSNLPPRNPLFIGREDVLASIGVGRTALTGLGGVGKSTVAIEHAHRHRRGLSVAWMFRAEHATTIASDYAALAAALDLPEKDCADHSVTTAAVREWLSMHKRWLLIFDNAEGSAALTPWLPTEGGPVIITSRDQIWGGTAKRILLPPLLREDAVRFLREHTEDPDEKTAAKLAEELGDLPLALEQARAYIDEHACSIAQYLNLFLTRRAELWSRVAMSRSAMTTWSLSMEKVRQTSSGAAELLTVCSFLAPEDIPRDLFVSTPAEGVPEAIRKTFIDELALNEAIATLRRYSLIAASANAMSIHRLVQIAVRDEVAIDSTTWVEIAAAIVKAAMPEPNDSHNWPRLARLAPHALHVTTIATQPSSSIDEILNEIGRYYLYRAAFPTAESLIRRSVEISTAIHGRESAPTALSIRNLGAVLLRSRKYDEALDCLNEGLRINRQLYGNDHEEVAVTLNDLCTTLYYLGRHDESFEILSEAIAIDARLYTRSIDSAIRLCNLGRQLCTRGELDRGLDTMKSGITVAEELEGQMFAVVVPMANIAIFTFERDLDEAGRWAERAVKVAELDLDPRDPEYSFALTALVSVRLLQRDYDAVRRLMERIVAPHARVVTILSSLRAAGLTGLAEEHAARLGMSNLA